MESISCLSVTPPSIYESSFQNVPKFSTVLKVPYESIEAYRQHPFWGNFWNIEAIEGTEVDVDKEFTIADGEEFIKPIRTDEATIHYTRTFENTNWQPLYVPFTMEYDEWSEWADVAEINNVHQYYDANDELEDTVIEFRKVKSGALKANTPYVIRAKESGDVNVTLEDRTLSAATSGSVNCCSARWQYTLTGVYEAYSDMVGKYALNGEGVFSRGTSSAQTLRPQRFYLEITPRDGGYGWTSGAMQAPQRVSLSVDGEATAIAGLSEEQPYQPAFNLQGQRVGQGYKGIAIMNGKKAVKK